MPTKVNSKKFSDRFQYLMELKKLTASKVAEGIGCHKSQVSRLRKRDDNPSDETLIKICEFYRCNRHWLETGEGDPYPPPRAETAKETSEFSRRKEKKIINDTLSKMERTLFKTNCPGYFDELFDFIGDTYGEDKDAAETFLSELQRMNTKYQDWLEEKKRERKNLQNMSSTEIVQNGE